MYSRRNGVDKIDSKQTSANLLHRPNAHSPSKSPDEPWLLPTNEGGNKGCPTSGPPFKNPPHQPSVSQLLGKLTAMPALLSPLLLLLPTAFLSNSSSPQSWPPHIFLPGGSLHSGGSIINYLDTLP
ncbi:hypothetical protein MLD38_004568 [Melastoma candidum]|uniref:Uncharacterized protein n=3 Tax=Melastoma candidum TaxID=119954 RepID=A0ACB9S808_9MYRT|nr:hypothetical protein MLD38_004566 [Melastoma candidum]KAI4386651.1 hypothetical protein MLD38_004567 [Melastoma candidum]KAI4386652.1 hypothetical protein MLD38_004568 [Melastoma candidum]